jgi:hypothetical protein
MAPLIAPSTFNQARKAPVALMLCLAIAICYIFVGLYRDSNNQINKNLEAENARLRIELTSSQADLKDERKGNKDLVMALLVSKEVQKALSNANKLDTLNNPKESTK